MRGADTWHLTGLAAASGRAVALLPAGVTFGLAVVFAFWQPHLQAAPAQDSHLHCFDFIDIGSSFSL
jgi:hypothetical protein